LKESFGLLLISQNQVEVGLLTYSFMFLGGSKLATPYIYIYTWTIKLHICNVTPLKLIFFFLKN